MILLDAEHALQAAQRTGDVDALDALLHPRCVGVGPDGSVFSKDDDLEGYRSGALRITRLEEESLDVQEDVVSGVTRLVAAVEAVQAGAAVSARLIYTRLWVRTEDGWQVVAATLAPAAELA
jgi:hypothetical protein